ncbi:helix-turn-helix domain-containing protein (plasmid) [Pseudarthrobacter sp. P1]|uniref:helix-turn-helix domain-containing protein n=1 Tax=Pseudarthrobacter sp. P1 TaxID=3418418 RepID=UPI003CFA9336
MSIHKPTPSNFLTIAEVADAIRLSKMTVYRLVQSHEIAAVRFGRQYRVPEEAVEEYIQRSTLADDERQA